MALDLFYQIFEIVDINSLDFERNLLTQENKNQEKKGDLIKFLTAEEVRVVNKLQLNYKESARFRNSTLTNSSDGLDRAQDGSRANSCTVNLERVQHPISKLLSKKGGKKKRKGTGFAFRKSKKLERTLDRKNLEELQGTNEDPIEEADMNLKHNREQNNGLKAAKH